MDPEMSDWGEETHDLYKWLVDYSRGRFPQPGYGNSSQLEARPRARQRQQVLNEGETPWRESGYQFGDARAVFKEAGIDDGAHKQCI